MMSGETLISNLDIHNRNKPPPPPRIRQRPTPRAPPKQMILTKQPPSTYHIHHQTVYSPKRQLHTNLPSPKKNNNNNNNNSNIPRDGIPYSMTSTSSFPFSSNNNNNNNGMQSISARTLPSPLPSPRTVNPHKYLKKHQSEKILSSHSSHSSSSSSSSSLTSRPKPLRLNMQNIQVLDTNTTNTNNNYNNYNNYNGNNLLLQTSPRTPSTARRYKSSRSTSTASSTRSIRSISNCSMDSNGSYYNHHRRSSTHRIHRKRSTTSGSISKNKDCGRNIDCICGRSMDYTQNPMNKYPPNAVLYCQQSTRCKKKIVVQKDWFFCCRSRTSYHGTKDGKFKICYSCSISLNAKQERIRKNHQLLIKQLKNKHRGKILITKDTKDYILSSTSSHSKDETLKLLKQTYIDPDDNGYNDNNNNNNKQKRKRIKKWSMSSCSNSSFGSIGSDIMYKKMDIDGVSYKIIKEGFMMKKGNIWNKSFKTRYFKLLQNKQLFYYKNYENGKEEKRGIADLKIVTKINKKGNNGLEITTPSREWKFLCNTNIERDEWYRTIDKLCKDNNNNNNKKKNNLLKKAKTYSSINPMVAAQINDDQKQHNKRTHNDINDKQNQFVYYKRNDYV